MPNIVIRNAENEDEVWRNVDVVRFLDEDGKLVSYIYNVADTTLSEDDIWSQPIPDNMYRVVFLVSGKIYAVGHVAYGNKCPLPPEPTLEGYTFRKWCFDDLLDNVTCTFVTSPIWTIEDYDPELTVIKFRPRNSAYTYRVYFKQTSGNITINWGDGTSNNYSTSTTYADHTYESGVDKEYTITIESTGEYYFAQQNNFTSLNNTSYTISTLQISSKVTTLSDYVLDYLGNCFICGGENVHTLGCIYYLLYCPQIVFPAKDVTLSSNGSVKVFLVHPYSKANLYDSNDGLLRYIWGFEYLQLGNTMGTNSSSATYNFYNSQCNLKFLSLPENYSGNSLPRLNGYARIPTSAYSYIPYVPYLEYTLRQSKTYIDCYQYSNSGYGSSIEVLKLPEGLTEIRNFSKFMMLQELTVPSTVTNITGTFERCGIRDLYMKPVTPPTVPSSISNLVLYTNRKIRIHVPKDSLDAYKSAANWSACAACMIGDL